LPDPDDGDPYARVNALTLLRETQGLIGALRSCLVVSDRAVGELTGRHVELALGLADAQEGETELPRELVQQMLAAALERHPELRAQAEDAKAVAHALSARLDERLAADAPDLKPLLMLVDGIARLLPVPVEVLDDAALDDADGAVGGAGARGSRAGLSGSVRSREEAIRAIDMVRDYLEQAEPSNPASLFLRRARYLINHNFLQLMKELAPDAMGEVARIVGVDPESVQSPEA
jgi:type VI secretion system protein ImpA